MSLADKLLHSLGTKGEVSRERERVGERSCPMQMMFLTFEFGAWSSAVVGLTSMSEEIMAVRQEKTATSSDLQYQNMIVSF